MVRSALHLSGVLPPITTPFDRRGELDTAALARNVARYDESGVGGYVAFGSTGEAVHLTARERLEILAAVRRTVRPGRTLVAGINEQSTHAALQSIRQSAEAGADAALVITPYFYKASMTQDVLRSFYLQVADVSALPVIIYNIPQNTGVTLAPATVAKLSAHDRIVGIKDSSGDLAAFSEMVRSTPTGFAVLVGDAAIFYPALIMGATGAILAVACVAPEVTVALEGAVRAGDHVGARELQQRLSPLGARLTKEFGLSGLKAGLDIAGYAGGNPRPPLRAVDDATRARIKGTMAASGFFPTLL